jgi:UPF0042 nucleotide-binding protein
MCSSNDSHEHRLFLITGPSGAGRSTAFHALEDLGYEVIDNLPFTLIPRLIDGPPLERPIALGIDVRNRDFNANAVIELIDTLSRDPRVTMDVLYLDCAPAVLISRYSQTRRRHPLTEAATPAEGIAREIDILVPIRARASHLIDTSEMSPHDLKAELGRRFEPGKGRHLTVSIQSFSYKRGLPRGLDMVFDCRFLTNPYWQPDLRDKDGRETAVAAHIESDPKFAEFFQRLQGFILMLLPAQIVEGKAYLAIGFGCTGGQHRSVVVVEKLAKVLAEAGWQVSKHHRELERRVAQSVMNEVEDMRA